MKKHLNHKLERSNARAKTTRRLALEQLERREVFAGLPVMVQDVNPNGSSFPTEFARLGNDVYFIANATQIWKTDLSGAGAVLVKDTGGSATLGGQAYASGLINHNGTLVFGRLDRGTTQGDTSDDRVQMWKSNGTQAGTVIVKDFGIGSTVGQSYGAYFTSVGGLVMGVVSTPSQGMELWKSNLTSAGTSIARDIVPGAQGSYPYGMTAHNGVLYFSADDGTNGRELWRSDGTTAGTKLLKDVSASPTSQVGEIFSAGDKLFFGVQDPNPDGNDTTFDPTVKLWKSDGTTAGTVLVKDFGSQSYAASARFAVMNGTLFGTVRTLTQGAELWKSNGTAAGTVLVKDIAPGPGGSYPNSLTVVGNKLFFAATTDANGTELWKSDGTSAGTTLVKDINPGALGQIAYNSLVARGGILYFAANDGSVGTELWRSDGTSSGTVLVQDINPGLDASIYYTRITNIDNNLFFQAGDGVHGQEPWVLGKDKIDSVGFSREVTINQKLGYQASLDGSGDFNWSGPGGGDVIAGSNWPSRGTPIYGDWNGDGISDPGIFTPSVDGKSPRFAIDLNGNGSWSGIAADRNTAFGPADARALPIVGDWNGDGKDEVGIWYAGVFIQDLNGDGVYTPALDRKFAFGYGNAKPLVGDWDGNGVSDVGFVKDGRFYLDLDGNRVWNRTTENKAFGGTTDTPIAGDWNGDGRDEIGVARTKGANVEFYLDVDGNFGNFASPDVKAVWPNFAGQTVVTGKWPAGSILVASMGTSSDPSALDTAALNTNDLDSAVEAAIAIWSDAGASSDSLARMANAQFQIVDLPGSQLGGTLGSQVFIDVNGAGIGWNTASANSPSSPQRYDLLTVVLHELGHVSGLDHDDQGVMSPLLSPGQRELPNLSHVDKVFLDW